MLNTKKKIFIILFVMTMITIISLTFIRHVKEKKTSLEIILYGTTSCNSCLKVEKLIRKSFPYAKFIFLDALKDSNALKKLKEIYNITLGITNGPLPVILLCKNKKIVGVVIGPINETDISEIKNLLKKSSKPFLYYVGPMINPTSPGCPTCYAPKGIVKVHINLTERTISSLNRLIQKG